MKNIKSFNEDIIDVLLKENKISKENFFRDLSNNFQKITKEIQKLQKNDKLIVDKINNIETSIDNIIMKNNLKI